MLHAGGEAVPLAVLIEADRPPLVGRSAAEVALFFFAPPTLLVFADEPTAPVRRWVVRELRLGDPDEFAADEFALIPSASGWWLRQRRTHGETLLLPLEGQPPIAAVLGRTAAECVLADGSWLGVEADHRPLVAICRPDGAVSRAPLADWLPGEEFQGVHGEWLFSSRRDGHGRDLLLRRVTASGLGPRLDLGRLELGQQHHYPCWAHLRGGSDDGFLAIGVSMGADPPLLVTAFVRAGRWTPLEQLPLESLALQVNDIDGVGRVFWCDDRGSAWTLLTVPGPGAFATEHLHGDEERFLGGALHLLGERVLGLWTEEEALVGRLGTLTDAEHAPEVFRVTGAGEYPMAEVFDRGQHAIVMLADEGRRWALRVEADGRALPLTVG